MQRHQAGDLAAAEALYRQVLSTDAHAVDAMINLGAICMQTNRNADAVTLFRSAAALNPQHAVVHANLAGALLNIGCAEEAVVAAREALRLRPEFPEALNNLGNALRRVSQHQEATDAYERALRLVPGYVQARNNYAACLAESGKGAEAVEQYRMTISTMPGFLDAWLNLANLLGQAGRSDEALAVLSEAASRFPQNAFILNNVGVILQDDWRLGESVDAAQAAIRLDPNSALMHSNLAHALSKQGRLEESFREYEIALGLNPNDAAGHSNVLLAMHYEDRFSPRQVYEAHRQWAARHAEPDADAEKSHANVRDPEKRLRVGFVSADFYNHPVGRFMLPVFEAWDRAKFEFVCYSGMNLDSPMTKTLQSSVDLWRGTAGVSDAALAEQIRRDGIDILVDLAGHTAHHRLLTFAKKPAPVQVTFLGYPDTTGLRQIDYRIVDRISDPPGIGDALHSERLVRLDGPFLCYRRPQMSIPSRAPADTNGYVTFGSFNNLTKLSARTFQTWANVLDAVPRSRLMIKAQALRDEATREVVRTKLRIAGIAVDRVDLVGPTPDPDEYLASYALADIALDAFPYNGTTTTCEALGMGVPVIALAGRTHVSRMGASLLTHANLQSFIAEDEASYVRLAADLAEKASGLTDTRRRVAETMAASALCDEVAVTRSIEAAFREMWQRYCAV